jgi:putative membrane protein
MYTKRYFGYQIMYFITWRMILWSVFTSLLALGSYHYMGWKWVAIPWLPVSLIGTAVAFYVGFKNNQSYDRSWEARTVWGGIVNLSRAFTATAGAYLRTDGAGDPAHEEALRLELRSLVYRHLAWLYALKHAMWQRTSWEHQDIASTRQRRYFQKRVEFPSFEEEARKVLDDHEWEWVQDKKNRAAQLLERQSRHLAELKTKGWLNLFHHVELQKLIIEMYNEQGKTERIKNTPLPRQYATSSALFILIFTFLLPFGMLHEFDKFGNNLIWLLLPFNIVVSWVFSLMEYTGDYSENPFEGLMNDVPIHQIVRNIEIDLRDMLGEKELPSRIESHLGVTF